MRKSKKEWGMSCPSLTGQFANQHSDYSVVESQVGGTATDNVFSAVVMLS